MLTRKTVGSYSRVVTVLNEILQMIIIHNYPKQRIIIQNIIIQNNVVLDNNPKQRIITIKKNERSSLRREGHYKIKDAESFMPITR